jgi:nucleoside-diphosphate-sugar epimerase
MQTILGAGGAIGIELAKELKNYTNDIRLVSRKPIKVNSTDQLFPADLLKKVDVLKAVKGSKVVYLTAGLKYNTNIWRKEWPVVMKNVIDACIFHKSRLVFFDNVYMIGGDNVRHITEESPFSPASKKGIIRAELDRMILKETQKGNLKAIIARSADFYGPVKDRSLLIELVLKNLIKGKKAQWFSNAKVKHSFTYINDAAKGTALLGNTENAYNQIWNLPTNKDALTGEMWIKLFADEIGVKNKYQVIPKWMLKVLGVFIPVMGEFYEMTYQYDREYYFDSTKFEQRFKFKPTSYREGIRETVLNYKF